MKRDKNEGEHGCITHGYKQVFMKKIIQNPFYRFKFDFEIGTLIKSPCKDCDQLKRFPKCFDECKVIDKLQTVMAEGRSCTRSA